MVCIQSTQSRYIFFESFGQISSLSKDFVAFFQGWGFPKNIEICLKDYLRYLIFTWWIWVLKKVVSNVVRVQKKIFEIQCDFQDRVMQVLDLHNTCLLEIIYCSNMNMFQKGVTRICAQIQVKVCFAYVHLPSSGCSANSFFPGLTTRWVILI